MHKSFRIHQIINGVSTLVLKYPGFVFDYIYITVMVDPKSANLIESI